MSELVRAIRQITKSMITNEMLLGKVTKFNSGNWTINVELNLGAKVEEVAVRSVLNSEVSGLFVEPKVGSYVLCSTTDGKLENLKVILFSEIENIELMPAKKMKLRGDDFGGLVKLQELENNLNSLKQYVEAMNAALPNAFNAILPVAPAPFVASGAAGAGAYSGAMAGQTIVFEDMENKNVSHG